MMTNIHISNNSEAAEVTTIPPPGKFIVRSIVSLQNSRSYIYIYFLFCTFKCRYVLLKRKRERGEERQHDFQRKEMQGK